MYHHHTLRAGPLLRCPKALSTERVLVRVEAEERRVHALMQVGRAMASTADYEQALAALIRTISELLNVESAGFMLYDPERSELVLQQPAFGFDDPERIAAYHVSLRDGGNAVKVFLSGRAYLTNDAAGDPRLIRRFVDLFDAHASLTVPLIVEDQAIGVCHAINKRGGPFTDEDLELLNLIAPLLAVSVQSAHLFRQVRAQGRQLERAIFLQRELSQTAFDAPGMGPLAERLADLVNRPVMVLDPALRPLATSRWPEELQPDEHWLDHGQREVWWRRGQDGGGRPVLAPIAVGSHFGGYLAVWDGAAPLDEIDARAIEHAATIFALEMLHERTSYELELRLKGDLLRDLSSGEHRDDRDVNRMLADLGYTIAGPWRFAQVHASWRRSASHPSARWRDEVQVPQARLYPAVQRICLQVVGAAAVVPWRSGFLMLLPATPENLARDLDVAADLLDRVHAAAEHVGPGARVHLAVSSPCAPCESWATGCTRPSRPWSWRAGSISPTGRWRSSTSASTASCSTAADRSTGTISSKTPWGRSAATTPNTVLRWSRRSGPMWRPTTTPRRPRGGSTSIRTRSPTACGPSAAYSAAIPPAVTCA